MSSIHAAGEMPFQRGSGEASRVTGIGETSRVAESESEISRGESRLFLRSS
jgi:hypothetical protein